MNKTDTILTHPTRTLLTSMAIAAAMVLFTGVPRAHAESEEECQHRIAHADHELHEAIERFGPESRQAEHERHELHEARERCWREHRRWWDEDAHRWHDQHDWDDRDHDRAYDHDR